MIRPYKTIWTRPLSPLSPLPVSVFKMFVFPTAAAQSLLLHFEMTRFHLNAVSRSFAKICMVHIVADTDWSYGLESFMQGTVFDFSNFAVPNIDYNSKKVQFREAALFASKAYQLSSKIIKIFERSASERPCKWKKFFHKTLILAFEYMHYLLHYFAIFSLLFKDQFLKAFFYFYYNICTIWKIIYI